MRAAGRPSGAVVASAIAVAFRTDRAASSIQPFARGNGSSGNGSGKLVVIMAPRLGFALACRLPVAVAQDDGTLHTRHGSAVSTREVSMTSNLEDRFPTLHQIVKAARANLAPGPWDYLVGGTETETTLRRNRQALDSIAFRPRVLRGVAKIDST